MTAQNREHHRETLKPGKQLVVEAISQSLNARGYNLVGTGCPIDDLVAVRQDGDCMTWKSSEPGALLNALGAKEGLVDTAVSWVPTVTALNADRTELVVAMADLSGLEGYDLFWPKTVDVISVDVSGELVDINADDHTGESAWGQLLDFLAVQCSLAVQRGDRITATPIQHDEPQPPTVAAWATPGDDVDLGEGFHIETYPEEDVVASSNGTPVAPYHTSSLTVVAGLMCESIRQWSVAPLNVTVTATPETRRPVLYRIPD